MRKKVHLSFERLPFYRVFSHVVSARFRGVESFDGGVGTLLEYQSLQRKLQCRM